jgi:hypothetical protein
MSVHAYINDEFLLSHCMRIELLVHAQPDESVYSRETYDENIEKLRKVRIFSCVYVYVCVCVCASACLCEFSMSRHQEYISTTNLPWSWFFRRQFVVTAGHMIYSHDFSTCIMSWSSFLVTVAFDCCWSCDPWPMLHLNMGSWGHVSARHEIVCVCVCVSMSVCENALDFNANVAFFTWDIFEVD